MDATESGHMSDKPSQTELIAAYKELLRGYLAKRPSGLRKRISDAIGTNRSFVSQITNPKYSVPIPSHYVPKIIAVCHLSPAERAEFFAAYVEAHPSHSELLENHAMLESTTFTLDLSEVTDDAQRELIKQTLKYAAESLIALAGGKGRGGK